MNLPTIVIGLIILILFIWAARKSFRSRCSGDCSHCGTSCHSAKKGETPQWVKQYRKDHPKNKE